MTQANADQIAYWNAGAGETWAAMQERLDRQLEPLGLKAMEILGPKAGQRILDIGCGAGQSTLALAEAVGPSGLALGLDISRPMLAVAEGRAKAAGLAQAQQEVGHIVEVAYLLQFIREAKRGVHRG